MDQTSKALYSYVNDGNGLPYSFQDLYGKVTLASQGGSKVSFFGFNFQDQAQVSEGVNLEWTQRGAGAKFIFLPARSSC